MALKITTQIGTDKGITSEAYVRIADYQVSKYGNASFRIELFQNQADSVTNNSIHPTPMGGNQARNQQIGDNLRVSLTREVEATRTVRRNVEIVTPAVIDENSNVTIPESRTWEVQDVEETYTAAVPDLSALEDGTIFAFGYSKLKEKLVELFGAGKVVDC